MREKVKASLADRSSAGDIANLVGINSEREETRDELAASYRSIRFANRNGDCD